MIKEVLIPFIILLYVSIFTAGFMVGMFHAKKGCRYVTVAAYTGGYYVGCELFKPRFKETEK